MDERGRSVAFRSPLSIGLHLGLAALTALVSWGAALEDRSQWGVVRWILVGALLYAVLACRQRVVLSTRGIRVQGMLLASSVRWADLRRVDVGPYQPAFLQGSTLAFAHQLVLHDHSGRWIDATCCPGSVSRLRAMQSSVIQRAELLQPLSNPSRAGRHRPKPELPTPGSMTPEERLPER